MFSHPSLSVIWHDITQDQGCEADEESELLMLGIVMLASMLLSQRRYGLVELRSL